MGNSQSSSGTQFIGNGGLPVLQSVEPCHLSGDPDLYGVGIRVGFYLQYLAAIIAIVSKADEDFVGWRVAFVPVAAATFLGLCINSTGDTLVVMDWAIMLELVLCFPAFFALPVFTGLGIEREKKGELRLRNAYAKQLEPIREENLRQHADTFTTAYAAVIHAEHLLMDDSIDSQRRPQEVRNLITTVLNYVHVTDEQQAGSVDHADISRAISRLKNSQNDLQAVRAQFGELNLREHHIAALVRIGVAAQEAKKAESAVREIAGREQEIRHEIKKKGLVLKRIHGLGLLDTVSAGISLTIYSAYCFLTPWLFFFGIGRGAKTGCDVRVFFILAPVSVYNHGFAIFLKVVAIFLTVPGLVSLVFGILFLIIGLCKPFEKTVEDNLSMGGERTGAQIPPDTGVQDQPVHQNLLMTGALEPRDQTQRAHFHRHWLSEMRQKYYNYINNTPEPSIEELDKEIDFRRHWWGFGLSVVLVVTIVVVEMTIHINHITMGPLLSSTGQLIALLLGAFMLFLILYKWLVKLYDPHKNQEGKNKFEVVAEAARRLLHSILPTRRGKPPRETHDAEMLVGLEQGGQGDGQTGSQTGVAQISGDRVVEIE
jgi:hypothetical protein